MTFTTWLGQTVSPGDTIVYTARTGCHTWFNVGEVLEIKKESITVQKIGDTSWRRYKRYAANDMPKPSKLTAFHNIIKIESPSNLT